MQQINHLLKYQKLEFLLQVMATNNLITWLKCKDWYLPLINTIQFINVRWHTPLMRLAVRDFTLNSLSSLDMEELRAYERKVIKVHIFKKDIYSH